MQKFIKYVNSFNGDVQDIYDMAIDDTEIQGSPTMEMGKMKKYASEYLEDDEAGMLVTYDENNILVRCSTTEHLKAHLLKFEPWEKEHHFEYWRTFSANMWKLKFFKQNAKRLYMPKYK